MDKNFHQMGGGEIGNEVYSSVLQWACPTALVGVITIESCILEVHVLQWNSLQEH